MSGINNLVTSVALTRWNNVLYNPNRWVESSTVVPRPFNYTRYDLQESHVVDPVKKFIHGPYRREIDHARLLPINSFIEWRQQPSRGGPIYSYHRATFTGWYPISGPKPTWLSASEKNEALLINRAIKGALNEQINLALFIGELDKTANLLTDSATRISRATKQIRSGRFAAAARTLEIRKPRGVSRDKTFANNWLKFSFGFGPIIGDIAGALEHLHTGARQLTITAKSRTSTRKAYSATDLNRLVHQETESQNKLRVDIKYDCIDLIREQVVLVFRPNSTFWDQASRLGFINPGQLAWQSYPLTFIADWFVNIGDWLAALNRGLTLDYLTGSYTEFHRMTGTAKPTWRITDTVTGSTWVHTAAYNLNDPTNIESVRLNRSVLDETSVLVSVMVDVPSSIQQAITAVALAVQRLK